MKKIILFSGFMLLIILASCTSPTINPEAPVADVILQEETMMKDDTMMDKNEDSMMKDETMMDKTEDTMMKEDTMMDKMDEAIMKDDSMMEKTEDTMMEKWSYTAYSSDMLGKTENTVVFFHANWCPSCRAADAGITWGIVPENLTILKADYDSETELKKKYGVTSQHTFVLVDAQGELIKKWAGGTTVDSIVEKL